PDFAPSSPTPPFPADLGPGSGLASNRFRPVLWGTRVPVEPPDSLTVARRPCSGRILGTMSNEAPVLIAGGGLTGLAAASFLAKHGIRSIAVERLKESSPLPRAAFFHMRTMEMFRELGIETRGREESAKEFVPDGALI